MQNGRLSIKLALLVPTEEMSNQFLFKPQFIGSVLEGANCEHQTVGEFHLYRLLTISSAIWDKSAQVNFSVAHLIAPEMSYDYLLIVYMKFNFNFLHCLV